MIGINRVVLLGTVYSLPQPTGKQRDKLSILVIINSPVPKSRKRAISTNVVTVYWKGVQTQQVAKLTIGDQVYIEGWLKQLTFSDGDERPKNRMVVVGYLLRHLGVADVVRQGETNGTGSCNVVGEDSYDGPHAGQ